MRKGVVVFLFFQILCFSIFSQDINSARETIDTLTSRYFAGRGAIDNGEKKAAEYIAKQFKRHGLKPINETFFQTFTAPLNTFPGLITAKVDHQELVLGKDFIVGAASNGVKGTFELFWFAESSENLTNDKLEQLIHKQFFKDKFVVLDSKNTLKNKELFQRFKSNMVEAGGIIFIEDKLTHHLSKKANKYAEIHVKRNAIDPKQRSISIEINQELLPEYRSQNVVGYLEGTVFPDSFIVLSAHYDHLGKMGPQVYFPGANDNASGVAMLIDMAQSYGQKEPPQKTVVFIAFGAEESGLVGSKYFVNHPIIPLSQINFVFNMDLMGTGSKGGMIVNGKVYKNHFERLVEINNQKKYLTVIKKRGKAANSDHYWFTEKGIPSFFIYLMGGISAYHDIEDVANTLPLTKYEDTFRLIRDFVDEL